MPGKHAKWSPSGSPYWFNDGAGCPARVLLPAKPETPSPAAEEGTRLHDLAAWYLETNDTALSGDDWEKLKEYCEYCQELSFRADVNTYIEVPVSLTPITGEAGATGTIDFVAVSEEYLEIVDLKTGGKIVPPTSNQLQMYAAAVIYEMDYRGEEVRCTIHQGGKAVTATYKTDEVLAFSDRVRVYIARAEGPGAPEYNASENNCQWCPHITDCEAQAVMRNRIAANDFAVSEDPVTLAGELAMTGALQRWIDEVRARALKTVEAGTALPGYKLVHARANRKWADNAEERLFALLGDQAYDRKLIGLTRADKLVDAETMNELTIKPEGKPTLAPEDDPRPAINDAATDFKDA